MFYMVQAVAVLYCLGSGIAKYCIFHYELMLQEAALRLNLGRCNGNSYEQLVEKFDLEVQMTCAQYVIRNICYC